MPEEGLASRATTHEGRRIGIGSEMFRRTVCKACYVAVFATSGLVFVCVRQTASMVQANVEVVAYKRQRGMALGMLLPSGQIAQVICQERGLRPAMQVHGS